MNLKYRVKQMATGLGTGILVASIVSGCHGRRVREAYVSPQPLPPLGSVIDQVNQVQETNAEHSDFVIYQHEFEMDTDRLNLAGKDHVKQIAARLPQLMEPDPVDGLDTPRLILIERSNTTVVDGTEFEYPVHPNPELDMQRREVIVRALVAMGIRDAEDRVVISNALTPGQKASEAERSYYMGLGGGFGMGGYGGYGGGFGMGGIGMGGGMGFF
ncbi:MAG: hypothetical protein JSS02_24130 [Planctomycetes bacterium]|nr:hypothetical protein [Planctomycetota bacterium]